MMASRQFSVCCITVFVLLFCSPYASSQKESRVVDYTVRVRVTDDGILEKEYSTLFEVAGKKSDWMSDIKIPYSKGDKLVITEAVVLDKNGEIVKKLNKNDIVIKSNISDGSFYEDDFVKQFSLRGNEYPYQVRYSYRISYKNFINVCNWDPIIFHDISTSNATLTAELPVGYKVKIKSSGVFDFKADTLEKSIKLSWKIKDITPPPEELFMPSDNSTFITIVPYSFSYGIPGSSATWESFGEWVSKLNDNLTDLPVSEKYTIDTLTRNITDKREIIRRLYHYMQDHTRYISVNIDLGGLKSYPASYVSTNKYGDCKALTNYLKALLKYKDIDACYTLVNAGRSPAAFYNDCPGQQFNHVILCVPMEKDTIWLENTSGYLPYNYLGTFTQDRYCLIINGTKSALKRTPPIRTEELLQSSYYFFSLNQEGNGQARLHRIMRGDSFEKYVTAKKECTPSELREIIESELMPGNSELSAWEIIRGDRDSSSLQINLEMTVSNQFRKIGNSLVLNPFNSRIPDLEDPDQRKMPVKISYPVNTMDSVVYELDKIGKHGKHLPEDINIRSRCGFYNVKFIENGNKIIIYRHFQLFKNQYKTEDYPEFFTFIDNIGKAQKKSGIIINLLL